MVATTKVGSRWRGVLLAGLVGLIATGGVPAARAHRTSMSVEIVSEQASLSPDGRSMTFDISTRCDMKWTIVEARATVTQPQAFGEGSFQPTCARIAYNVRVTVPVVQGVFETGPAQANVVLVMQQGSTKRSEDSGALRVRPDVSAVLADRAVLQGDGAVLIDVTVTCPRHAESLGGSVRVYDGVIAGGGSFGPTPCDAAPHTVAVRVSSPDGAFRVGSAEALASASVVEGGDVFPGGDLRTIQIVPA